MRASRPDLTVREQHYRYVQAAVALSGGHLIPRPNSYTNSAVQA